MYDFLHKRKRAVQVILALITLPFAFFGVDYYFRDTARTGEIATVAGSRITQAEFDNTLREQQERMRQTLGRNFDPAVFDDPEVRYSLLDGLIGHRLLQEQARRGRFSVSDDQLRQFISEIPAFQDGGKFSQARYEQLLAMQNPPKSPIEFAREIRRELMLGPVQESITGANIVAKTNVERYLGLLEQQRAAAVAAIDVDAYLKDVKIDDAAVRAFYDANAGAFQVPEEVKLEYVTLTPDALGAQSPVDPAEVRKQYDENARQYGKAEERQAAHILIAVKPDASEEDKANAKKKAEEIAAQAKKSPAQFGELAKKLSEDPGSAAQGGDLGIFARDGSMVKPFEDAVFSMKAGEIAGPVQSDFGWHVIKLGAIHAAKQQSFDEVKAQIEQDLRRQKGTRKFAEAADQLQNLVYEQADSLQPVAKALNLTVQSTPLLSRAQVQALAQNNVKFVQAVFSADSLQSKRNTEAMEIAPGVLMAARVVEYKPASLRPFDDVKAELRRQLERKAASELAQAAGKAKLALLQEGKPAGVTFGKPATLTRSQPQPGYPPAALAMIFQADATKLPAYAGSVNERGGYSLYRIERIIAPTAPDAARLTALSTRVGDQMGRELAAAYVASLKAKADVKINQANLEKEGGRTGPAGRPVSPRGRRGS
ncbi:MAG: SurA N-terminal domain-containing protein [Pseudomonadota bacterium]|nr:SurA N-terminal domain-containing protein [Pseudomonadota bacterium]